jgi:lysophospholipase L1-like esterase
MKRNLLFAAAVSLVATLHTSAAEPPATIGPALESLQAPPASAAEPPAAPKPDIAKPNPERFAKDFAAFAASDQKSPPPKGAIVMTGSSSMRGWHRRMKADLAPLTLIPRGFGGSMVFDLDHYLDQAVLQYAPRAVVVYEGDNDLTKGFPAETVLDATRAVVDRIHAADPAIRVYLFAVKPSPSRARIWPEMQRYNALLRAYCDATENLAFIDVATPLLDANGGFREELYVKDRLHLSDAGYDIWRDVVRAVLIPAEGSREAVR